MGNFVHLHVHSEHSGLDSTARVRDLVRTAARMGQPAVAITDHGTLAGIYDAIDEGKKQGVKVIAGLEAYLAIGSRHEQNFIEVPADDFDTDAGDESDGKMKRKRYHHITVLAKSATGWRNLVAMHNASAESMWGKHRRIDYELLKEHSEDLIVLTGCLGGPVLGPMASGDEEGARKGLEALIDAVGHSNVYVEIMEHGIPQESKALKAMAKLAREYDLPLVATNDSHYIEPDGARAHEAWLAMQTGKKLTDPAKDRFTFTGDGYHFRTAEEMRRLREEKWWAHACNNTLKLAERIEDDVLPETYLRLPSFPIPEGFESSRKYLAHLIREGAKQRWGDPYPKEVAERLKAEMRVIAGFGVVDYFLIVHDVISWARSQGIRVGPGRGSAAGSAISFALGIVQVDPLRYDLLFERFLDPTRVGMPDIDIDFEKGRRDEVFAYLADKYGWDHVARIGTFQMSKTKAAIKSAARVLGYPVSLGDKISKAVPMAGAEPYTFSRIDETRETDSSGFWETVEDDDRGEEVIDLARRFENVVTGASIHACGVVIADESLTDLVPLRRDTRGEEGDPLITEWDADGIEGSGLLKLDVLGLRNLDIVSAATRNVHAIDSGTDVDPDHLPDTDDLDNDQVRNAWRLLAAGHTAGVFQLESQGMTELAQDVQPTSLEHLSALVALYRPGPLSAGLNDAYASRKNGRTKVSYDGFTTDPDEQEIIASVLGSTYGVCVADGEQVYSVTRGHPVPIQDIQVGEVVQGVNDQTFTDSAGKVLSVINSGIKEVVEARFSAGFTLRATPDHRVLTPHGWTAIQDLSEGDLVATPTSVIADAPDIGGMDDHQARVLGSLLADGGISYRTNVTLYATTPEITRAFHEAVALGFPDCHTSKHVRPTGVVMTSVTNGGGNGGKASSLVEWLRELGLKSSINTEGGVTSEDKFIPDEWLAAPDHLAAVLLAAMWDCDGHISNGNQGIRYKTISARLAAGIRFLLLRLGILTNISEATYGDRTAFDIQVVSREKFVDMVAPHMVHPGKSRSARENGFEDANTNLFYRDDVRAAVTESYRGFSARTGIPSGSLGRAYRYSKGASAARVAQETGDEHLNHLLNSRWVKFQGYKPTGVSQVWDLEVEGIHSFTASGVIVHNCAYQEQMMQIGDVVAGFGPSERNRLRKAVSRKDQAEIDAVGELFMQGATSSTGIRGNEKLAFRESTARELWRTIQGAGEYAFNRCLPGDTVLTNGSRQELTLESLYRRLHGMEPPEDKMCRFCHERPVEIEVTSRCRPCASWHVKFGDDRGFYLLAVDSTDHRIRPQRVKDVHFNGVHPVFKVKLSSGLEVTATANHRFMQADGSYVEVQDMEPGVTSLSIDGGYEPQVLDPEYRLSVGSRRGVGRLYGRGEENIGYIDGGSIALKEWTDKTRPTAQCDECGKTEADGRLERAHLDGVRSNNRPENLSWKCVSHHKKWDYRNNSRRKRWDKGGLVNHATVVSVERAGTSAVFDVEMVEGSDHNFLANGIVSHNSHSAAYGQLAYVTAYLKANWPAAFGAAILGETKDEDKRRYALASLAEEGVEVLPPNVNTSGFSSTPVNMTSVVLGLGEIKDVGKAAAPIVSEREENGPFTSAGNILDRVRIPGKDGTQSRLTVRVVEALIEAGACDDFGPRKGQLRVLRALRERPGTPIPGEEWGLVERAVRQHSRLGLIVGTHPIRAIQDQVKAFDWPVVKDEWRRDLVRKPLPVHRILTTKLTAVSTIGLVTRWKVMPDNRGGQRADVQIEGTHGRIQAVVWNDTIRTMRSEGRDIDVGSVVAVTARVRIREIEQEDDEGNTSTTEVRSLTITNIWPIDYLDVDGSVPAVDLGINLNARCFSPGVVGRVEPAPKLPVPDADSEELEELIAPERAEVEDLLDGDEPSNIEPQTVKEYQPNYIPVRPQTNISPRLIPLFTPKRKGATNIRAKRSALRIARPASVHLNSRVVDPEHLMLVRLSGDSFDPILIPISEHGESISHQVVDRVLASEGVWRVAVEEPGSACEVFEPADPAVLRIDEKSLVSK